MIGNSTTSTTGATHQHKIQRALRQGAVRRNLRTAAVLALAISGAPFGMAWLAATCGGSFLALMTARILQLRQEGEELRNGTIPGVDPF